MCCECTKPCDIKSFHVGSVFELDVVQSSGLVWARLGGSSSSQILREAVFVLQALQFYLQRKPQAWSVACQAIPSRGDPEKSGKSYPPVEVSWELGNPGLDCKKRRRLQACADMFWAHRYRPRESTPTTEPKHSQVCSCGTWRSWSTTLSRRWSACCTRRSSQSSSTPSLRRRRAGEREEAASMPRVAQYRAHCRASLCAVNVPNHAILNHSMLGLCLS